MADQKDLIPYFFIVKSKEIYMNNSITPQKNYVRQTNYFSQKKLHAILILFLFIFSSAWADDIITIDANDQTITKRTTWTDCTVNISGNGTITYSERITINGTVHLNIEAGSTLKANRGISVIEGNSLTIDGEGSIIATTKSGDYGSALGGADANGSRNAGSITILGGNISATSQNRAAGIGGANKGNGGNITISGGTVYAKAAYHAAGIGGGCNGNAGTITISGGIVSAVGDGYGAGIGGGDSDSGISGDGGNIVISGGQVTATGGSGGSKGPGYGIGPGGPRYNAGSGAEGSIFLSWENESDFIDASSYVGAISFAENKRFYYDGSTDYATTEGLYKQSKKIVPVVANNNSLTFAEIQMRRYYTTTSGTAININYDVYDYNGNKLTLGNDYTAIIKNSNNEEITTFDQLDDYTLTIIGKGSYSDSKSFTFSLVQRDPNLIQDGTEYYINFPNTGKQAISLAANQTIKVYDSEGKNGNYIASDGFLKLYAPEGYAFEVTGEIDAVSHDAIKGTYFNTLNVYEDNDETTLITSIDRNSDNILFFSSGNEMLMHFQCPWPGSGHGLDLTVKVVQATSHTITVENSANGSIESDKKSANANEEIQLTVSTAKGYLLKNISIIDSDNGSTIGTIGEDYWYTDGNIVTFQMPGKNITLTPEFTNDLTAANGLTLKIDPLRISEYTIPDSVISFNISGSANTESFTTAILKSQAGYRLRAGGLIKFFEYYNRELAEISIYDGPTTSSTLLTNINGNNYKETAIVDIGTQTSTSNYITIYLKENELNAEFTGTIEVVYNISYELAGGSVAIDNIDDYTHETETFTLTNPTRDGYEFAGWIGTGLEKASTEVTIAKGSSGNRSYTATWIKPLTHSDITIAIPNQTYTGSEICPAISITDGKTPLTLGTDYTVSYSANINAGTAATAAITGMGNYSGSVEKEFTIAKAPLTITAKNKTIAYGDEPANDGVEYTGFVGEEDASVLGGSLTFEYNYEKGNSTGDYAITPSGLTADNYKITFVDGKLTVEPKEITISWDKQTSFTYNGTEQAPTATAEGLVDGDECTITVSGAKNVGSHTATATKLSNNNYKLPETGVNQEFEITKAPLTVTAKNATIVYGEEPSNAGVEYRGFVGDDNENDLNDSIVFNYDYAPFDKVGIYVIIPGGLSSDNYNITFGEGELTVEPKEISIAWSDASFTYNGSEQIPMATANGVENSDECIFTVRGAATKVGKYTAKVTDLSNENYKLPATGLEQAFEIKKAPLKITALNDTIVYGDEPASAGIAYDGFVGKETSNVLTGELAFEINYKQYGDVGEFAITPSGLTNDNYEIEFVAGKLTVEPKVVSIAWDKQTSFTYNSFAQVPAATAEGLLNNDQCDFTVAGAATDAGKYTATVTGLNNKNYKLPATGLEQSFEIAKIPLTVTAKNNTIVYGDEPSNAGVEYNGFVGKDDEKSLDGELVYSYGYTQYGDVGEYSITPGGMTADNYEIEFVAGKLGVESKAVSIVWDKSSFTYNGTAQVPTASAEGLVNSDKCDFTVTGAAVNAGKYSAAVTALNNANYKLPESGLEQPFEILKANPTIVKAPAAVENLVYNGKAQTLVTAGEAKNGTLVYKIGDAEKYSETLPAATDAGDYTVYFMVLGDENYNDLKAESLAASIAAPASSSSSVPESSSAVESSSSVAESSSSQVASSSSSSRNDVSSSSAAVSSSSNVPASSSSVVKSSSSSNVSASSSSSAKPASSSSGKNSIAAPAIAKVLKVVYSQNTLFVTNPAASDMDVLVFDVQGNLKTRSRAYSAGEHQVSLQQLNQGVYIVRVETRGAVETLQVRVK